MAYTPMPPVQNNRQRKPLYTDPNKIMGAQSTIAKPAMMPPTQTKPMQPMTKPDPRYLGPPVQDGNSFSTNARPVTGVADVAPTKPVWSFADQLGTNLPQNEPGQLTPQQLASYNAAQGMPSTGWGLGRPMPPPTNFGPPPPVNGDPPMPADNGRAYAAVMPSNYVAPTPGSIAMENNQASGGGMAGIQGGVASDYAPGGRFYNGPTNPPSQAQLASGGLQPGGLGGGGSVSGGPGYNGPNGNGGLPSNPGIGNGFTQGGLGSGSGSGGAAPGYNGPGGNGGLPSAPNMQRDNSAAALGGSGSVAGIKPWAGNPNWTPPANWANGPAPAPGTLAADMASGGGTTARMATQQVQQPQGNGFSPYVAGGMRRPLYQNASQIPGVYQPQRY